MTFDEPRIKSANCSDPEALYKLIVTDLCGERYYRPFSETDRNHLTEFLAAANKTGISYATFNELLLLLEQDRVSEGFYRFFFSKVDPLKLDDLTQRIARFRGYAMLCYGNFRYAYRDLSTKDDKLLARRLSAFWQESSALKDSYEKRPPSALNVDPIDGDKTWFLGYVAGVMYEKESKAIARALEETPTDREALELARSYQALGVEKKYTRMRGLRNTDVYLTWDFMDVYVATSMRNKWEFEDVSNFVSTLFSDERLRKLKLRYFNPTQSDCVSRIDKGLVEALMLKRAACTVYLVQESDTLGKDSELASTLAQGKPVIAFVDSLKADEHAEKIKSFPLEFFKIRLRSLQATGAFEDPEVQQRLSGIDSNFAKIVSDFLNDLVHFEGSRRFAFSEAKQLEFKEHFQHFGVLCRILAVAEGYHLDKRAALLKSTHPLSLQVHLESGVANGVLVVRTPGQCADVLYNLLTNSTDFSIERSAKEKCTILKEGVSESPFRAVSEHEKLSNSFWNFYLASKEAEVGER
jgi:hypothetical protein